MHHVVDLVGRAAHPWGYVAVFLAVMLEASAFVGLVVPGETVLLAGGFLASQHKLNPWTVAVLGLCGAVIGDSIGYEIGRHFGERLQRTRLGRKVGDERWERARETLRSHGGKAVLIGRWVGVLRALVPAAAGDSRLPYRTFLLWNVIGALVWAPTVVIVGYVAGSSWEVVDRAVGWGSLAVVGVLVAAWLLLRRVHRSRHDDTERSPRTARRAAARDSPSRSGKDCVG